MPLSRVAILFCLGWFFPCLASAQLSESGTELAANAALQYWQAFAQMPALNAEQQKLLDNWHSVPLDASAQKLIAESNKALMYLRRGARLQRCDWGLDYNDGVSLLLPHLAKARELARLAALRARYEFEQGHTQNGQADARSIMTLGRHVGRDSIMISLLVGYLIEGIAVDLVAPHVSELEIPYAEVKSIYEALPRGATVQQAVMTEKVYMSHWIAKRLAESEVKKPGSGRELWHEILQGTDASEEVKSMSVTKIIGLLEELDPVYDELAGMLELPHAELEAQFPSFKDKIKSANAAGGLLLPAIDKFVTKERSHQARLAMLLAAFAVAEGGPGRLQELRDPFGDGPFEYRPLDQGFELKSRLKSDGQPVTLTVGSHKN